MKHPLRPFIFVHAADLHVDSPFKGISDDAPGVAQALRDATYEALRRLVTLCIDSKADFLLLAGDVFDSADRSVKAQLALHDGLSMLAEKGIGTFIAYGNHDPLSGRVHPVRWPSGVRTFPADRPETHVVTKEGTPICTVTGVSYEKEKEGRNLALMFKRPDPDLFAIGLLHCSVGTNPAHASYAPCLMEDLLSASMDYWALGHVHERTVLHRNPFVAYPGNTQGRSFREQGERGCLVARVDRTGAVKSEFHALDSVRWRDDTVKIDGLESLEQLDNALSDATDRMALEAAGRPVVCRITLAGRGPLYPALRQEDTLAGLVERLREDHQDRTPFVWVQELALACRPETDLNKRRMAGDFLAEVLATAQLIREEGADGYARLRDNALASILKPARIGRIVGLLDDREMEALLAEAELICLDLLEQQGE